MASGLAPLLLMVIFGKSVQRDHLTLFRQNLETGSIKASPSADENTERTSEPLIHHRFALFEFRIATKHYIRGFIGPGNVSDQQIHDTSKSRLADRDRRRSARYGWNADGYRRSMD